MINYSIVMRSVNANLLEINRRQKRLDLFDADLKSAGTPSGVSQVHGTSSYIFFLKAEYIFP